VHEAQTFGLQFHHAAEVLDGGVGQIVDDGDVGADGEEDIDEVAADETCAAGDADIAAVVERTQTGDFVSGELHVEGDDNRR